MLKLHFISPFIFAIAAIALFFVSPRGALLSNQENGVIAKVVECDDGNIMELGNVMYGPQALRVEILEGEYKGKIFRAGNFLRGQLEFDKIFKPGDKVLVSNPRSEDDALSAKDHWRLGSVGICFVLFAILLVVFAGFTGLNALSSFLFCCIAIWKIVIPLMLKGWNAPLVAFIATAFMTALIMLLVGGFTKKALAAFGGAMLGVASALALAYLFGAILHINGATLPFAQTLVNSGFASLDLADVFIAATILAASGAMMDLAMDISAGVREVSRHNPNLSFRELLMSGIRIGRATVGTMTTTLLLAYSGGYLTLLMVFAAQGTPPQVFLNSPLIAAEIAKTLVGSFAIVLVAPFTALLSAALFPYPRQGGPRFRSPMAV
ncbi:MAG: YibE/F family protein [Kiritimatiellae bacterium]|nr:YibE/F family protein [Kiritimatiellia bacterium]